MQPFARIFDPPAPASASLRPASLAASLIVAAVLLACVASCTAPRTEPDGSVPSEPNGSVPSDPDGSVPSVPEDSPFKEPGDEPGTTKVGFVGAKDSTQPAPSDGAPAGNGESASPGLPIQGFSSTRYRFRSNSDEDHDLSTLLSLQIGNPKEHSLTGHFLGWANADLDGRSSANDAFRDINDAYSKDVTARLYEAYGEFHRIDEFDVVRLGRQPLYETPEFVTFDGLRLETRPHGEKSWRFGAYGGVPVHHFESSSGGDAVLGAYVDLRPWQGGRTRLDYMYLEDDTRLADHQNDLFGAQIWQSLGTKLRLEGGYTALEGDSRDVRARASWFEVEEDLVLRLSFYELFETQRALVTEFDPFFDSLREHFPFYELQALVAKGFAERYRTELGGQVRRLREREDEGQFNREFERYFARFVVEDLVVDDLTLGLTGEVYDAGAGRFSSWSADLEREWNARWKTAIGTYYALYRFDIFELRERNDVRVYFLDAAYRASKRTRLAARYEFEDDDLDDYHVLKVGLTWRF